MNEYELATGLDNALSKPSKSLWRTAMNHQWLILTEELSKYRKVHFLTRRFICHQAPFHISASVFHVAGLRLCNLAMSPTIIS